MKCQDEGTLLLYLEHELPIQQMRTVQRHVNSCPRCAQRLRETQQNLEFCHVKMEVIRQSIMNLEPTGQQRVWRGVQKSLKEKGGFFSMKMKRWSAVAAMVMVVGLVAFVPSLRLAVADFLQVFRVEKVQSISFSQQDMEQIEEALEKGNINLDIDNLGGIRSEGPSEERTLTEGELSELSFQPWLPAAKAQGLKLGKVPALYISPQVQEVNQVLSVMGSEYLLPEEMDGQTVAIKMGEYLEATYDSYRLIVGPAPQLEVPSGVRVQEVARALVNLPIWPETIKQQLLAVDDWEHTLVIPGERVEKVNIHGQQAALVNNAGARSLIWQEDGLLYIVEALKGMDVDLEAVAQGWQ